jgi:hypothetical protein
MFTMAAVYADEALRLANERLDGLHEESRHNRIHSAKPSRVARIRASLAAFASPAREVEIAPLPRLSDYPYRP